MTTDTKMTSRSISTLVNKYNKLEGKSACRFIGQGTIMVDNVISWETVAIKKMQKRMIQN